MTAAPIRIGVAGVGEIGLMHAEKILRARGCELVALGSSDPERAAEAASALGTPVPAHSYEELFSHPGVDAVVITSRSPDHPGHVSRALDARKHVLVEKPASLGATGWDDIRRAHAERPELVLQVGYMRRFDPRFRDIRERITSGVIGRPLTVDLASREDFPPGPDEDPAAKGGLLLDIGIHDFDVACWLMDDEPTRCYASGAVLKYRELGAKGDLDTALAIVEFRRGGRAQVHLSRASALGLEVSCDVYGTGGSLHLCAARSNAAVTQFTAADRARFPVDYRERFGDAFRMELAAFVAACRGERGVVPGLETDVRAVSLALAARRSLVSGAAEPVNSAAV